jgi:hypothetical protein
MSDISLAIPSFRTEGGVAYYEVGTRSAGGSQRSVWKRFREFVQLQRELAGCGLDIESELPSRVFRQSPNFRRPQLQRFLRDAAASVRSQMVRELWSQDPCPSPLSPAQLRAQAVRAQAALDAFTGRGPAVQGRSLFATLMCSVGSSICAGGAAEVDDGDESGAAAAAEVDDVITVNEMGGRQFELRLPGSSDISEVKVRLERAGAAPVGQQALFVSGAEDECRDDAVVSQLLPDGGVPRVLFLLVKPHDRYVQTTGPGESQPDDFEIKASEDGTPPDYLLKLVFIGDEGVGKSALLHRVVSDSFSQQHNAGYTGVDCRCATTFWHGQSLKLQMWDTPGRRRLPYPPAILRGATVK